MANIREYWMKDFDNLLAIDGTWKLTASEGDVLPTAKVHLDLSGNAKFISYYVPSCSHLFKVCETLLSQNDKALKIADSVELTMGFKDHLTDSKTLVYTNRVFIYSESDLLPEEKETLISKCASFGIFLCFRGPKYVHERNIVEKPLAFISHDSQDKDQVARPLAIQLTKMMCPVWYDEFSLKIGDSLRQRIEEGIKECKKCIVIISPYFLKNNGWTKKEFDSIFTRELIEEKKIILPVWHGVTKKEVFEYSPSLVDVFAADWSRGPKVVAKQLYSAINLP